jgi:hypothetical protein
MGAGKRAFRKPNREPRQQFDVHRMSRSFRLADQSLKAADDLTDIAGHMRRPTDPNAKWRIPPVNVTSDERVAECIQIAAVPFWGAYRCEIRCEEVVRRCPGSAIKLNLFHSLTVLLRRRGR